MKTTQVPMPLAAPTLTEFNPSSISANATYTVSTTIQITSNISFPANVTLIFLGGRLITSAAYSLNGNNTHIIAGIAHIFDIRFTFTGSWITDRAYPQWFGADNTNTNDATAAINKAIEVKRVGEVFIPRGTYKIQGTIKVKTGIILKGEKAYPYQEIIKNPPTQNTYEYQGTVLYASSGGSFLGGYMLLMNVDTSGTISADTSTWIQNYPEFHTGLYDLYFYNRNGINNLKGVLAAGGFDIKYCRWHKFSQAVGTTNNYSDLKSVTHCVFFNDIQHTATPLYAFDLRSGDATTFKNVTIYQNLVRMAGALRLTNCFGAEVANNIFNLGVLIRNCKGINFSSNHMEQSTTQVVVENSSVNVCNNYFEKGTVPCLVLNGTTTDGYERTVVTLDNNCFAYYENEEEGEDYNALNANRYDIMTNGSLNLSINKSFRYWVTRYSGASVIRQAQYGLMICKTNQATVPEFNDYSYFLSNSGQILPAYSVSANNSIILLKNNISSLYHGVNSTVKWKGISGSYTYRAQVLWDKTRRLVGSNTLNLGTHSLTNKGNGFLASFANLDPCGACCIIRLERSSGGVTKICDVPLCGTLFLYDNGLDICGYPWETGTLLTGLAIVNTIQFSGRNIICRAASAPQVGTWTDGDIVFNTGSGTNSMWIRVNGAFIAK